MKRLIKFYLLFFFALVFVGCKNKETVENADQIKIGVVETTGEKYKSFIHWYDEELEVVDVQNLNYANLGDSFSKPVYAENKVFLIPQGLFGEKDTKKAISINQDNFTITEYDIPNIALQEIAVTDDYIFVNSNLNFETHLSRFNRKTAEFTEKIYEEAYFESMVSVNNKIFLFGNLKVNHDKDTAGNYLYILDVDFNMMEIVDLSDIGSGAFKFLEDGKDLYVSVSTTMDDQPNSILLKINTETYEYEIIELEIDFPDSLVKYEDHLLIAQNNIITGEGSLLTLLDLNTNEKETVDLNQNIFYMDIYQKYLVVSDDEKISLFDIDGDFQLIKEVPIDKREDTYISGIIVLKK